jgi:GC-rich sequence DNA-binding factor
MSLIHSCHLTYRVPSRASPGSNLSVRLEQTSIAGRSEGPKYDASYLEDLKAYTNSARPAPPPPSNDRVQTMDIDSGMMLDASEMNGAFIENENDLHLMSSAMATETMIPTESSIKAARDKRDRLRKTGAPDGPEEDFISLSVAKREDFAQGPHPDSRLMREDDDLGEGDDGNFLVTLRFFSDNLPFR